MTPSTPDAATASAKITARRELGWWTGTALGLNAIVGSSIFLLPARLDALIGASTWMALLIAASLAWLVGSCFARIAQHHEGSGGAYLYTREAFGAAPAFLVGWISWWSLMASGAAITVAASEGCLSLLGLAPTLPRRACVVLVLLLTVLTFNLRGVRHGGRLSLVLTLAKLTPLLLFVVLGLGFVGAGKAPSVAWPPVEALGQAVLLMFYGFTGFDSLTVPAGEMQSARKRVPHMLRLALGGTTLLYAGVILVTQGLLPDPAQHTLPLAAAAERVAGPVGRHSFEAALVLSTVGILSAMALVVPRYLYVLARDHRLPGGFGTLDASFAIPRNATLLTGLLIAGFALSGAFYTLAQLSTLGRLLQYLCVTAIALRSAQGTGRLLPLAAFVACAWLLSTSTQAQGVALVSVLAAAGPVWWLSSFHPKSQAT